MWSKSLIVTLSAAIVGWIFYAIQSVLEFPYMDEIFHIRQAQKYCSGNWFEYDDKLTTPPGLYVCSVLLLSPFRWIKHENYCSVVNLRSVNLFFTFGLFLVLRKHFSSKTRGDVVDCLAILSHPFIWFCHFLYYTDVASSFWVILGYHLSSQRKYHSSALSLLISLTFRQTNIIWALYFAVLSVSQECLLFNDYSDTPELLLSPNMSGSFLGAIQALPKCWKHLVLNVALPYGFVGISFIAFVYWNQGIVLGDKSNHVAMFHVPQLFYFVVALSGSLIFQLIFDGRILDLFCFVKRNIAATVICISLVVFFIERFTYEHPFLLSDNRHYTFYIWRRLTPMIRRFLAPLYVAAMIITWRYLAKLKGILFTLGYFACCSLVLVPTPLLEPRYFILPIMFYRMQCCKSYSWLEVLLFSGVNAFTTWMFLYKPFEWPSEPGIKQRFIW